MKRSFLPPTDKQSDNESSRKREKPRAEVIPSGFHPLSEKMADVLVAMQKEFVYFPDWWRQGEARMRKIASDYYQALRRVLRESLPNQRHLARCRHCAIFF
jgi:hypothetical protein